MRGAVVVAVILAGGLALAACTASSGSSGAQSDGPRGVAPSLLHITGTPSMTAAASASASAAANPATSSTDLVQGLVFPTDAYHPTVAVQNLVAQAQTHLTTACMAGFGFTYTLPAPTSNDAYAARDLRRGVYGIADLSEAQQYGYHLPPDSNPDGGQTAGSQKPPDLKTQLRQPGALLALTGTASGVGTSNSTQQLDGKPVPKGGCNGQAQRAIYPDGQLPAQTDTDVSGAAYTQSGDDPHVSAAIGKWQDCMAGHGYQIKRDGKTLAPLAAGSQFDMSAPVTQAEIDEAVTDVGCKRTTNLIGIWFAVQSAYESAGIQQNIQQLKAEQDEWTAAAQHAAAVLGIPVPQ